MITRLNVAGYKCLKKVSLALSNLNLLVGANASGKSSIIQTLLLLRQSAQESGIVRQLNLRGDLYEAGLATDVLHPEAEHHIGIHVTKIRGTQEFDFVHNRKKSDASTARSLVSSHANPRRLQPPLHGSDFIYLNAERAAPKVVFNLPSDTPELAGILGKHGEFTAAFLAAASNGMIVPGWSKQSKIKRSLVALTQELDQVDLRQELIDSQGRLDLVANVVFGWIIPGAKFKVEENLNADNASLGYLRDLDKTRSSVRSTHSGFGLTYALPIIAACLAQNSRGLLIIENPEAHLHPYSQSRMGVFLAIMAAAGRQIIIETHSDHIVNGVRLAVVKKQLKASELKIHFFKRPRDGTTASIELLRCNQRGRIAPWPIDFFDQIERDLSKL